MTPTMYCFDPSKPLTLVEAEAIYKSFANSVNTIEKFAELLFGSSYKSILIRRLLMDTPEASTKSPTAKELYQARLQWNLQNSDKVKISCSNFQIFAMGPRVFRKNKLEHSPTAVAQTLDGNQEQIDGIIDVSKRSFISALLALHGEENDRPHRSKLLHPTKPSPAQQPFSIRRQILQAALGILDEQNSEPDRRLRSSRAFITLNRLS